MRQVISFFLSYFFWGALALYVLIIALLPPMFQKFRLEPVHSNNLQDKKVWYSDLNSSGVSETILEDKYTGNNAFVYADNEGYVLQQVNIEKPIASNSLSVFADYNNNGFKEHYFFTMSEDSIFLNASEYPNVSTLFIKDRFITTIDENLYDSYDFEMISRISARDINHDGYKEILFNITAGFSYRPRTMYAYDVKNDSLYVYDAGGIHFFPEYFFDFNDGEGEKLLFSVFATNNHRNRKGIAYPDTAAWLLVCNENLEAAFEPVPIGKAGTYVQAVPIKRDDSEQFDIFVLQTELRQNSYKIQAHIYSSAGELLNSKVLSDLEGKFLVLLKNPANYNYVGIIDKQGIIRRYDYMLNRAGKINQIPVSESTENIKPVVYYADINQNGENEVIIGNNNVVSVLDSSLKHQASLTLENKRVMSFSLMTNQNNEHHISFTSENNIHYLIRYKEDKLYPFRFLIFAAVFLGIYFFFVIIIHLRTSAIRAENKKLEVLVEKRTLEIQQQKNQLDELNRRLKDSNALLNVKNQEILESQKFKQMFAAMAVHDLKVPLNTVYKSVSDTEIKRQIDKMLILIENIVDIYKLDDNKIKLIKETVNVSTAVKKMLVHVESELVQKNISIQNDYSYDICVEADRQLFERILVNLLSNAAKYTPNNGSISILAQPRDSEVEISVINTGKVFWADSANKNIPEQLKENTPKFGITKSSGIGLQFCRLALQALGSCLLVQAYKSNLTCFAFRLPKETCIESDVSVPQQAEKVKLSQTEQQQLKPYIEKLKQLEPYEASEINLIMSEIQKIDNSNVQKWANKLRKAVNAINNELYRKLLNM